MSAHARLCSKLESEQVSEQSVAEEINVFTPLKVSKGIEVSLRLKCSCYMGLNRIQANNHYYSYITIIQAKVLKTLKINKYTNMEQEF